MRELRDRWQVGGEFDRSIVPVGATMAFPTPHRRFSLATHSVAAVWRLLEELRGRRLHIPDYFCPEVTTTWQQAGLSLVEFRDDPRWPSPDWASIAPAPGDLVLAVNYFGVREGSSWARWHGDNPEVLLIEDHSHDPGSRWARHSEADYAFASIRKMMPVSDGAILWSPRGLPLPDEPHGAVSGGSMVKLAAMTLKREFLGGGSVDADTVRALQLRGEHELLNDPPAPMAPWNIPFVLAGLPHSWRRRRRRNVRELQRSIADATTLRPMFVSSPRGHCPFNLILLFDDAAARDACRLHLIANQVFPPVHWLQPATADVRVRDLSSRILTIPIDQRYGPSDVERVGDILMSFDAAWACRRSGGSEATNHSSDLGAR